MLEYLICKEIRNLFISFSENLFIILEFCCQEKRADLLRSIFFGALEFQNQGTPEIFEECGLLFFIGALEITFMLIKLMKRLFSIIGALEL